MVDHKRKKKRGRSKLFMSCFRSFALDERSINIINNNNNSDSTSTTTGPILVAENGCKEDDVIPDVNSVNANVDCSLERSFSGRSRSVSRLLKSVLFDSVMVKKICGSSKSSTASYTSDSFSSIQKTRKQSEDSNACGRESTDIEDSSSRCSTLLSSSSRATSYSHSNSSSSSTNSTSQWLSEPKTSSPIDRTDSNNHSSSNSSSLQKPNPINSGSQTDSLSLPLPLPLPLSKSNSLHRSSSTSSCNKGLLQLDSVVSKTLVSSNPEKIKSIGNNSNNIRWCLFLLLSLIVLVVYGRIYAILCTSIWFYLVPCRRVKRVNSSTNDSRVLDTESEQYKKRVIMAGLLDRTRNPLR